MKRLAMAGLFSGSAIRVLTTELLTEHQGTFNGCKMAQKDLKWICKDVQRFQNAFKTASE